ncbi:MAG TPA: VWA domain-containing protein [Chloroflexaceae bacterium]|nr:VWA domain-containing protein [Chloroflexaceae bacterium]
MTVLWPWALLLLGLAPALVGLYVWLLRRRRRYAVRYSSLSLVREALAPGVQWRRHLPFALFLLALVGLALAVARPVAVVQVPTNETSIVLALDVSRSMCSTDIPPNRLIAAQAAALEFIERQPPDTRFGIVAFAGFAQLIQEPTADRRTLEAAVRGLTTARATAIGSGILTALDAIADTNPDVAPVRGEAAQVERPGAPADAYVPEIIVLLTDGVSTTGPPAVEMARLAAERGVRIYTIGFGTPNGSGLSCTGQPAFGEPSFGGPPQFGGGGGFRRGIDEETLIAIADLTGGEYYAASSARELQGVFADLPISFRTRAEETEVGALFAAAGALLAILAIGLSLRWNPLP